MTRLRSRLRGFGKPDCRSLTDFRAFQHVLIGRKLFVIKAIPGDAQLRISPTPDARRAVY